MVFVKNAVHRASRERIMFRKVAHAGFYMFAGLILLKDIIFNLKCNSIN